MCAYLSCLSLQGHHRVHPSHHPHHVHHVHHHRRVHVIAVVVHAIVAVVVEAGHLGRLILSSGGTFGGILFELDLVLDLGIRRTGLGSGFFRLCFSRLCKFSRSKS
jgi:hypothetical protein